MLVFLLVVMALHNESMIKERCNVQDVNQAIPVLSLSEYYE